MEYKEIKASSLCFLTWVCCGWNSRAEGGIKIIGGDGGGRLLDTGGYWVDVVACWNGAWRGKRLQGCYLPLGRRWLAVNGGGAWAVGGLYFDWYWQKLGKGEMTKQELMVRLVRNRLQTVRTGFSYWLSIFHKSNLYKERKKITK